jgi:septum formation protein
LEDDRLNTHLILASASPRRRELLALLSLPFEATTTDIDEQVRIGEPPEQYARRLSQEKANAAARHAGVDALILAADTIVVDGVDVLGKPSDAAEAASILRRLRGHTHRVYTAVTLLDTGSGQAIIDLAGSPVQMRAYNDDEIVRYIASGDPFDKAGAYAIQHNGFHPARNFEHCMANVMGLPLCHIARMLRQASIDLPVDVPAVCQAHIEYKCPVFGRILSGKE